MGTAERPAPVLVTGATGVVAPALVRRLLAAGERVHAVSRRGRHEDRENLSWERADLSRPESPLGPARIGTWFHVAPLWLAPALVSGLAARGLRRVLAFGSTSRFTKSRSPNPREREIAERLARAEDAFAAACAAQGVAWTVFRPTLAWGGGRDQNVSTIARLIRRFGVVPLAGAALGARQPVHVDDLVDACLAARDKPATFGKGYDLPGGETLSYLEMVARIARGMGRRPRVLHLPVPALQLALTCARILPRFAHLSSQMADRMNEDLVFDSGPARRDFGYAPRPFVFPDAEQGCR